MVFFIFLSMAYLKERAWTMCPWETLIWKRSMQFIHMISLSHISVSKWRHGEAVLWKDRCDAVSGISVSNIIFTYGVSLRFGAAWGLYNELSSDKPWWSVWWCSQSASSFRFVYQPYPVIDRSILCKHLPVWEEVSWHYSCLWFPIHPAHFGSSRRFSFSK